MTKDEFDEFQKQYPYEEKLNDYLLERNFHFEGMTNHLVILDIENDNRRQIFNNILEATKWVEYNPDIHQPNDDFKYRYINDSGFNKKGLFKLLKDFNKKVVY